ncbi:MAG: hypothetical protein IT328_10850 [Caldilineaceae bacterium]|nr:hypothetical protein [Caldilineaceae bacterium]
MKIESRVEALELELKILKNEIQNTLLEVREQILNHYYPELRAEEPPRAQPAPAKPYEFPADRNGSRNHALTGAHGANNTPAANEPTAQILPFSDIFLQDFADEADLEDELGNDGFEDEMFEQDAHEELHEQISEEPEDEVTASPRLTTAVVSGPKPGTAAGSAPKTREVVFKQLKNAPVAAKAQSNVVQETSEPQGQKPSRPAFGALAAWVGTSVAKAGKERTIQAVETYAASGGALPTETKSVILQLVAMASDEEPQTAAGNQEMLGLLVELDQVLGAR